MGNRAVITTEENFIKNGVGVYIHWNGGRTSVECFLKYCKLKRYRAPETDCYGWARLCQVIGNFFGGDISVGIDVLSKLDCDNGDNGTYLIKDWEIVGREYEPDEDYDRYDKTEFLVDIDNSMPESERLGEDFIRAKEVSIEELRIGDIICDLDWRGKTYSASCIGFSEGEDFHSGGLVKYPIVKKDDDSVIVLEKKIFKVKES